MPKKFVLSVSLIIIGTVGAIIGVLLNLFDVPNMTALMVISIIIEVIGVILLVNKLLSKDQKVS